MPSSPRDRLIRLFEAGVARADPHAATTAHLPDAAPDAILALGKAAIPMARAALDRFAGTPTLVVTNPENAADLPGAEAILGAHPVPDAASARAGAALLDRAAALGAGRRALVLISGGGSALAIAPVAGVTPEEKAEVSRLLLGAGLDIEAMNAVRRALSRLKGGGLARAAAPARLDALILSDVIGDDPQAIASGPTVAPTTGHAEARAVLRAAGLWDRVAASVRAALDRPDPAPPPDAGWTLIGSNALSLAAMGRAAPDAAVDPDPLVGDVADAAARIAAAARRGPGTTLWGGETTVVLRGRGRGGRNQELALRVALALKGWGRRWTFLSGGTDGRDGPTEAAGAVVDDGTLARMRAAGIDPVARLADNDANPALAASGDLLVTGGTGTNVADLQALVVH
ncbi:DUF4147 domain-containing protein [Jannaschia sp. Os4]|nr:DUF4147 domain-containing protein [Jannaschia sp. Os4]